MSTALPPGPIACRALLLALILAGACCAAPAAAAVNLSACPGCLTVWKDPCTLFGQGNETAYAAAGEAAFLPIAANLTPPADYRNLSWTEAFIRLNARMEEQYAFTEWRGVDFAALNATCAPRVAAAEKTGDRAAYYRALREYLYAIPDGHVLVVAESGGDFGAKYADIGGGYGLSLVQLNSGDVVVGHVENGSAAERAGVRPGDEVTGWNAREIHAAIDDTPLIWAVKKPSTEEGRQLQKTRLLARAPVGTPAFVKITYGNVPHPRILNLTAYDDGYATLKRGTFFVGSLINDIGADNPLTDIQPQLSAEPVAVRSLPGGYTYIAVYEESYAVYRPVKAAVEAAAANRSPGLVIDLRYNKGGDDNLAACMAGWFVKDPVLYEYLTKYDPGSGQFTPLIKLWTAPQAVRYSGPVALLVSPDTISSGEGLPALFNRTGTGAIVSFYGTNGAFGLNNVRALMPEGLVVLYPDGASLGADGTIQVDSNVSGTGGIAPTVRVPLDQDTLARSMAGEDVQLTYALDWLKAHPAAVPATAPATTPKASAGAAAAVAGLALLMLAKRRA